MTDWRQRAYQHCLHQRLNRGTLLDVSPRQPTWLLQLSKHFPVPITDPLITDTLPDVTTSKLQSLSRPGVRDPTVDGQLAKPEHHVHGRASRLAKGNKGRIICPTGLVTMTNPDLELLTRFHHCKQRPRRQPAVRMLIDSLLHPLGHCSTAMNRTSSCRRRHRPEVSSCPLCHAQVAVDEQRIRRRLHG